MNFTISKVINLLDLSGAVALNFSNPYFSEEKQENPLLKALKVKKATRLISVQAP
jgi:hypothetical protein